MAYQKVCQELEETQKSVRLVIEQAGAAEQQAKRERECADESAQALVTYEGKLKDVVEEKQKLSQTNVTMSKELDNTNRRVQEGFAQVVEPSKEATKWVG